MRLPDDVVHHIATVIGFLDAGERDQLIGAIVQFQDACREDDRAAREQANARIVALIAPLLPDHVRSLSGLEKWTRQFHDGAVKKLQSAGTARRDADFWRLYSAAKAARGWNTPLKVAQQAGLDVRTITLIESTRTRPGPSVRAALEQALGLKPGTL